MLFRSADKYVIDITDYTKSDIDILNKELVSMCNAIGDGRRVYLKNNGSYKSLDLYSRSLDLKALSEKIGRVYGF